jgi:hypothetical protein
MKTGMFSVNKKEFGKQDKKQDRQDRLRRQDRAGVADSEGEK